MSRTNQPAINPASARRSPRSGTRKLEGYCSVRHPDFTDTEAEFLIDGLSKFLPEEFPVYATKLDVIGNALVDPRRQDRAVFAAIEEIGLGALRPEFWEVHNFPQYAEFAAALAVIRDLVWKSINRWFGAARSAGTPAQRGGAAKNLRRIGAILAGDRRGIGKPGPVSPFDVYLVYSRCLFRLNCALSLLKVWPWASSRARKVDAVAEACGISKAEFWQYLQLDDEGHPKWATATPRQAARVWTATAFGITEQTVSNVLAAGYRKRSSRK